MDEEQIRIARRPVTCNPNDPWASMQHQNHKHYISNQEEEMGHVKQVLQKRQSLDQLLNWVNIRDEENSTEDVDTIRTSSSNTTPLDIWHHVFSFLDWAELLACEAVDADWQQVLKKSAGVWRDYYSRTFRSCQPTQLTASTDYKGLTRQRVGLRLSLSSRAKHWTRANGLHVAVNNSLLRHFSAGACESVRTVEPLQPYVIDNHAVIYFEVTVRGKGASVGLCSSDGSIDAYGFASSQHVGWCPVSVGFHSDDGHVFVNDGITGDTFGGRALPYDKPWGIGLTRVPTTQPRTAIIIGCGLDVLQNALFFTKNGSFLSFVPTEQLGQFPDSGGSTQEWAAAVTLHQLGDSAELNFGSMPFAFDLESFCDDEA